MARHYPGVLRAREDRNQGRLWKARDRLHGVLKTAPADQETLELLGTIYYEMRDLPNAGRYWFLTDKAGAEVDEALAALHERHPFPDLLDHVPARAPADQYPPAVRVRLEELKAKAAERGVGWKSGQVTHAPPPKTEGMGVRDVLTVGALLVLGPGLWLFGIASAIHWLVG